MTKCERIYAGVMIERRTQIHVWGHMGARHGFTEARMTGDATHLHWYNRSISSYLRRGRFFTAFPGRDTNEYVLLLFPPERGVALTLGSCGGRAPVSRPAASTVTGAPAGGDGRPVTDASDPLATLPT